MKQIVLEKDLSREAWLALRRTGIGGSDASVACGMNRYRSPIELWLDKTGQMLPEDTSESAYWGNIMEPIIREEFSKRTELPVSTVNAILQREDYPYMIANLDGIVQDPVYGDCIFEAKTASAFKAYEWEPEIPQEYYLQAQHVRPDRASFKAV